MKDCEKLDVARPKLKEAGIQHGFPFSARLICTHTGHTKIFESPKETATHVDKHTQPAAAGSAKRPGHHQHCGCGMTYPCTSVTQACPRCRVYFSTQCTNGPNGRRGKSRLVSMLCCHNVTTYSHRSVVTMIGSLCNQDINGTCSLKENLNKPQPDCSTRSVAGLVAHNWVVRR